MSGERPGVEPSSGVYHDYPESVSSRKHLLRKIDKSVNVIQECANIKKFFIHVEKKKTFSNLAEYFIFFIFLDGEV